MTWTKVAKPRVDAIGLRVLRFGWLCVLVPALCTACAQRQNDECRAFVQAVNLHLAEIEHAAEQDAGARTPTPENMHRLARLYRELAETTQALSIGTGELRSLRDDYRAMVLDAANLAKNIATSLEAKDVEAALKTHERFGEVVSREDALVARVNNLCRGTP